MLKGNIQIYRTENGSEIEVKLEGESVWLDAHLIAAVFKVNRPAVVKHIQNIYKTGELKKSTTCSILEQVAADGKKRKMNLFNLDMIISVGYRVNSKQATRFRQWATQRLKDHLVKGYTVNQKRLEQLHHTIQLIEKGGKIDDLTLTQAKGLIEIISGYTQSFILLNQFDSNKLSVEKLTEDFTYEIEYQEALGAISELKKQLVQKKEAGDLFGNQKDDSFAGILGSIVQTFDGAYLYKSIEEQASHLLYFVIKNHPFSDGNKRIGAFLFVWFLEKNRHRFKKSGELKINDNALVALALLVAQSNPSDKEIMIKLIINLIKS